MSVLDTHTVTDLRRYRRSLEKLAGEYECHAFRTRCQNGAHMEERAIEFEHDAAACQFAARYISELLGDDEGASDAA